MTADVEWVKWRFSKWRGDASLHMCSTSARGIWIELLAIMHECEPYGHLLINGRKPTVQQIASLVGMTTPEEVKQGLAELEENGVFSITDQGVIYCRRMVRDKFERDRGRAFGLKGGNPSLVNGQKEKEVNGASGGSSYPPPLSPPLKIETESEGESETESERKNQRPSVSCPQPPPASGGPAPVDVQQAFDAWNFLAGELGLPKARILDASRRKHIAVRLREDGGISSWNQALAEIRVSSHCRGQNDRGWRADLDFVCQARSFRRLIEGSYRDQGAKAPNGSASRNRPFDARYFRPNFSDEIAKLPEPPRNTREWQSWYAARMVGSADNLPGGGAA